MLFSDKINHIMIDNIVKHLKAKNNMTFLFARFKDFSAHAFPEFHSQKSKDHSQIICCILSIILLSQGHEAIFGTPFICHISLTAII